jgi:hypothetical protein
MVKKRIFEIIEKSENNDIPSAIFDYSLIIDVTQRFQNL